MRFFSNSYRIMHVETNRFGVYVRRWWWPWYVDAHPVNSWFLSLEEAEQAAKFHAGVVAKHIGRLP